MTTASTISTTLGAPPLAAKPASQSANPLLSRPILSTLARLSLPNMIAMVATALVAIAETSYVGRLGIAQLAGIALVFPMVMLQQMMSGGAMGGGVSSAIARAIGAGESARAEALARHAVIVGAVAGTAFLVLFLLFGPSIYRLLGGNDAALEQALAYSNVVFLGAPFVWLTNTLASIARGTGNMRVPSVVLLVASAMQVVLGGGLGLGLGPFPFLGMAGIALGQVIAFACATLYLGWYLVSGRARLRLRVAGPVQREMFRDILKVGAVACLSPVQSVLTVLVVTRLVATFGTEALAGYGIGARLEFLIVPITFAIGVASVPMVGMAIGAGNVARARRVAWTAGATAFCIAGLVGTAVALFPDVWSRLFTSDDRALASARSYFTFAGPAYGFFGLALALYFASQGSGKILGPVLAQSVRLLVIAVGGWWLTLQPGATAAQFFMLVGAALAAYGVAAFLSVWLVAWGPQAARPSSR